MSGRDLSDLTDEELDQAFDNAVPMLPPDSRAASPGSNGRGQQQAKPSAPFEVADFLDVHPVAPTWLIGGLALDGTCLVLGGEPKAGKSFVALHMALCCACGQRVLGRWEPRRQAKVLIYSPEGGPLVASNRLHQLVWGQGIHPAALRGRLLVLTGRLHVDQQEDYQRLLATIQEHRPDVLLVDPLVRVHRANENAAEEIQPVLEAISDLRDGNPGLSVWLVHHVGKGARDQSQSYGLRGSSALAGWYDTLVSVRVPDEEDQGRRVDVLHRLAAAPGPVGFRLIGGAGQVEGLESIRLQECDPPKLVRHGNGRSKAAPVVKKLDPEVTARVVALVADRNATLTRSRGAEILDMERSTFNRYFAHLEREGDLKLDKQNRMVVAHVAQQDLPVAP